MKTRIPDIPYNPKDPSPWLALYLDESLPLDRATKADFLQNASSPSRQFLLPILRPLTRLTIALIQLVKIVIPRAFTSSKLLDRLIYFGMRNFVSPEACRLILRHFCIGSEIIRFLATNIGNLQLSIKPLRPKNLEAVLDDLFVRHDINLFNFIIEVSQQLKEQGREIQPPAKLNFDAITDGPFDIDVPGPSKLRFIDVETAIELYTPLYQLLLTDSDFWRASHSLQFDETIAVYVAKVLGNAEHLGLVNNRHPLVPLSTLNSGFRLMLHGLASEILHAVLVRGKRAAAAGNSAGAGLLRR